MAKSNVREIWKGVAGSFATEADARDAGFDPERFPLSFSPTEPEDLTRYAKLEYRPKVLKLVVSITETDVATEEAEEWSGNGTYLFRWGTETTYAWEEGEVPEFNSALTPPADESYVACARETSLVGNDTSSVVTRLQFSFGGEVIFIGGAARLALRIDIAGAVFNGGITSDGVTSYRREDAEEASTVTLSVLGDNVPLYVYNQGGGDPSYTYTGSVILTVEEWWPYAYIDGSEPWWDASTGAPIAPNPLVLL